MSSPAPSPSSKRPRDALAIDAESQEPEAKRRKKEEEEEELKTKNRVLSQLKLQEIVNLLNRRILKTKEPKFICKDCKLICVYEPNYLQAGLSGAEKKFCDDCTLECDKCNEQYCRASEDQHGHSSDEEDGSDDDQPPKIKTPGTLRLVVKHDNKQL